MKSKSTGSPPGRRGRGRAAARRKHIRYEAYRNESQAPGGYFRSRRPSRSTRLRAPHRLACADSRWEGTVARFRLRLIPREERFFEDFASLADELCKGAALLEEMLAPDQPVREKAAAIKDVEHRCDQIVHDALQRLNRTFVTPIDREDIYALLRALDDVIDDIDAVADMLRLYRIEQVRPAARELARLITASTRQVHRGLGGLEARAGASEAVAEIVRLESQADAVYAAAVGELFDRERDAIALIKWKEILDMLEGAADRCKDVATAIEGVLVKHA
ncbi:MAG: DUF47 family protein [Deltaproteobacteria bacterium]|nr:MAG: DUF47 family protein [Deltaproteobacteria bacterium]